MKFFVKIKVDNAAFAEDSCDECLELARILKDLATRIEDAEQFGWLRDINGNTVGTFGFEKKPT